MKNLFTAVISEIKLFLTNEVKAAGFASQQQHQFISENLLGIPFINNSSFRSAGFAQPELFNQLCLREQGRSGAATLPSVLPGISVPWGHGD